MEIKTGIGKKGMYFTLMTIAFLCIFLFIFMVPGYKREGEKMAVIEMRVESMDNFIKNLERDTERGLYISSFRAIMALEEYIVIHGEFINNVESSFKEALLNGTVNNTNTTLMLLSTFPLWIEKMKEESIKFNIETNISLHDIRVYQNNPWYVNVDANMSFAIKDSTNIASWSIHKIINTSLSILSFEDPVYIVNSYGRATNLINITPFEGNYTYKEGEQWKVNNLLAHVENSYYTNNPDAPSFLMRFEGRINEQSAYGIESLVNLKKLSDQGLEIYSSSSIVDHYYWDQSNNGNYRINFTPSWFKLDYNHRAKYNVTHLSCEIGAPGCTI